MYQTALNTFAAHIPEQVVEVDGDVLEKPADATHAASMLNR